MRVRYSLSTVIKLWSNVVKEVIKVIDVLSPFGMKAANTMKCRCIDTHPLTAVTIPGNAVKY